MVERLRRRGLKLRRGENIKEAIRRYLNESKLDTEEQEHEESEDKKSDCSDGKHCPEFKQVGEAELLTYLKAGWQITHNLANGQVIISHD